ncbi:MAG: glycosyltransferase family 4 protein [Pseudomonadota bacterium]
MPIIMLGFWAALLRLITRKYAALGHRLFGLQLHVSRQGFIGRENLFQTHFPRRVLLSYITYPFQEMPEAPLRHSQQVEARAWAELLHERGYIVDVVDFDEPNFGGLDRPYELVCGFGLPYEQLIQRRQPNQRFFYYATGCHPTFQTDVAIRKLLDFERRYHFWPRVGMRLATFTMPLQFVVSDEYLVLGDDAVAETYQQAIYRGRVHSLHNLFLSGGGPQKPRTQISHRKSLLWFGSFGCVHKGLIDVLEAMRSLPDYELHLGGLSPVERSMLHIDEIFADVMPRVTDHGFVRVGSPEFSALMARASLLVFPSISEGVSGAVLTALAHAGGYPILSRMTGVELEGRGIKLPEISPASIVAAVQSLESMPDDELLDMINDVMALVCARYHCATYQLGLRAAFDRACETTK